MSNKIETTMYGLSMATSILIPQDLGGFSLIGPCLYIIHFLYNNKLNQHLSQLQLKNTQFTLSQEHTVYIVSRTQFTLSHEHTVYIVSRTHSLHCLMNT